MEIEVEARRQSDIEDCVESYTWVRSFLNNTNGRERLKDYVYYVAKVYFLKEALVTMGATHVFSDNEGTIDALKASENLSQAYTAILDPLVTDSSSKSACFTLENVLDIHRRIGAHHVFEHPGVLRQHWLELDVERASLAPCLVSQSLRNVLADTEKRLERCRHVTLDVSLCSDLVKIAAALSIQFAYIQPFEEGNETVLKYFLFLVVTIALHLIKTNT